MKLNSTATAVLYATYLGGSGSDVITGLAIDPVGDAYVAGSTSSNDFPTQSPMQAFIGSVANAFVTKLNPDGTALLYSTYLGQTSLVASTGIAVDSSRDAYVVGSASVGFPTTSGAFQQTAQSACALCNNAFVAKLNPAGSALLYASYLGGASGSDATAVVVDPSSNIFITGEALGSDFPLASQVQSCAARGAAFLSEFDAAGTLTFSTCLGRNNGVGAPLVALDAAHNVYISAVSDGSLSLVNTIDANAPGIGPLISGRPFISEINPSTHALLFSTFFADIGAGDVMSSINVDSNGNIYAAGTSQVLPGTDDLFPIFNALYPGFTPSGICTKETICRYNAATLIKISPAAGSAAAVSPSQLTFGPQLTGTTSPAQTATIYDLGTDPLTISHATVTGDFGIQNGCGAVPASGGSCTIQVTFSPTVAGSRTGTLTITDTSAGSPHFIALSGTGGLPVASLSPIALTFPSQPVGSTSPAQVVTLVNTTSLALQISHVAVSGAFVETNTCGGVVAAHDGCEINVTFSPNAEGAANGTLQIADNAADSPQNCRADWDGWAGVARIRISRGWFEHHDGHGGGYRHL